MIGFFSENTTKNAGMAAIKLKHVQYTDYSLQAVQWESFLV